jgi:hypothetical protein
MVDFEVFRPDLEKALAYSDESKSGQPPFDAVLMFKMLVIQTLNNPSDERTKYLINDRLSFRRFPGLRLSDRVPDAKAAQYQHRIPMPRKRIFGQDILLLDKTNTVPSVWADTAYRSKTNEDFMEKQVFVSKIHRKKPHLKPVPRHI